LLLANIEMADNHGCIVFVAFLSLSNVDEHCAIVPNFCWRACWPKFPYLMVPHYGDWLNWLSLLFWKMFSLYFSLGLFYSIFLFIYLLFSLMSS
jgi:uncharacterized protein involved in cysteine biosynthesis